MLWAFRLPPVVYFALAPVGLLLSGVVYYTDSQDAAARAQARSQRPPAEVKLESFDRQRNVGTADEIVILGQADPDAVVDVQQSKNGRTTGSWTVVPLYATNATDRTDGARGVVIHEGELKTNDLEGTIVGMGSFGPIMKVDGRLMSDTEDREVLTEGVGNKFTTAPNAVVVEPFLKGREAGLAAKKGAKETAIVIALVALLIGGYGFFRRQWAR